MVFEILAIMVESVNVKISALVVVVGNSVTVVPNHDKLLSKNVFQSMD